MMIFPNWSSSATSIKWEWRSEEVQQQQPFHRKWSPLQAQSLAIYAAIVIIVLAIDRKRGRIKQKNQSIHFNAFSLFFFYEILVQQQDMRRTLWNLANANSSSSSRKTKFWLIWKFIYVTMKQHFLLIIANISILLKKSCLPTLIQKPNTKIYFSKKNYLIWEYFYFVIQFD